MNLVAVKHDLISAEVKRLRVRAPCTIELRNRLEALTMAFSQMPRPDSNRFMRRPTFNRDGMVEPVSDSTATAFAILNNGDGYGVSIKADNVEMIENLFIYCEPDVILWIIPSTLRAIQDRWNDVSVKANSLIAVHEPVSNDFALLLYWNKWYALELQPVAQVMDTIADIFCDITYTAKTGIDVERRRAKFNHINQYMTQDMRREMKAYLTLWYETFGRKKAIVVNGQRLPKVWAHNFKM